MGRWLNMVQTRTFWLNCTKGAITLTGSSGWAAGTRASSWKLQSSWMKTSQPRGSGGVRAEGCAEEDSVCNGFVRAVVASGCLCLHCCHCCTSLAYPTSLELFGVQHDGKPAPKAGSVCQSLSAKHLRKVNSYWEAVPAFGSKSTFTI